MRVRYPAQHSSPASSIVLVTGDRVLLVTGDPSVLPTDALFAALGEADASSLILDLLSKNGHARMPSFVFIEMHGSDARVLLRGTPQLHATTITGTQTLDGTKATICHEHEFMHLSGIRLVADPAARSTDETTLLLESGVIVTDVIVLEPSEITTELFNDTRPSPSRASDEHVGTLAPAEVVARLRFEDRAKTPAAGTSKRRPKPVLVMPDGSIVSLTRPVQVGRKPTASPFESAGELTPLLITIVDQDVSRTHLRFEAHGAVVLVTDLHSVNGSQVAPPGRSPQRLPAGEPTPVPIGTVITLGDSTIVVDER